MEGGLGGEGEGEWRGGWGARGSTRGTWCVVRTGLKILPVHL